MHTFSWTRSLKPQNQDAVGSGENYIAVADGITPLNSGNGEAEATACFSTDLMHGLEYYGVVPDTLRAGLTLAILYAQECCELDEVSSTLTVATWDEHDFRIATLGDCIALVLTTSGWRIVCDPNYADHDEKYLTKRRAEAPAFRRGEEARQIWYLYFLLIFNVFLDHMKWGTSGGGYKIRISPQRRDSAFKPGKFLAENTR